ncbi:hypothetical protein HWB90_gp093 [Mycobacterium phage Fowlmouth]|uniref:Uncharacterized protein n=1 Tax=Mycobacterium phage Fowlmouth TaxID=2419978 RepID=A0A3G2KGD7_9CAUD|nr:hypothetical protein HWB90_gp093 [Mycobacterium phage Fowlmouth]AYN58046.1 hypothetical protein SEA_FOWLMOUTH_97 [Mycobacterium phage Fowlmouth]
MKHFVFYEAQRSAQIVKKLAELGVRSLHKFKWEWSVVYDKFDGDWWPERQVFQSRRGARQFKSNLLMDADPFIARRHVRNVRIQRRLVSVEWQDYSDTFSYNEKGNGNGR